jgi:hypothetical protein
VLVSCTVIYDARSTVIYDRTDDQQQHATGNPLSMLVQTYTSTAAPNIRSANCRKLVSTALGKIHM